MSNQTHDLSFCLFSSFLNCDINEQLFPQKKSHRLVIAAHLFPFFYVLSFLKKSFIGVCPLSSLKSAFWQYGASVAGRQTRGQTAGEREVCALRVTCAAPSS